METTKWSAMLVAFAMFAGLGCTVGVDGGTSADLEYVDIATFADRTVYLSVNASHQPFFEATEGTVPVRVEFYQAFAVAWDEVDGRAAYGRNYMRAVWRVLDRTSTPHVLSGSVEPGTDEPPVQYTPAPSAEQAASPTTNVYVRMPSAVGRVAIPDLVAVPAVELALVDWRSRLDEQGEALAIVEELQAVHPGCL